VDPELNKHAGADGTGRAATRCKDEKAAHTMAIVNNLVIGLCLSQGFSNLANARRVFDAHPKAALNMLISAHFPTVKSVALSLPTLVKIEHLFYY
jgi:hypothetical protein